MVPPPTTHRREPPRAVLVGPLPRGLMLEGKTVSCYLKGALTWFYTHDCLISIMLQR